MDVLIQAGPQIEAGPRLQAGDWVDCTNQARSQRGGVKPPERFSGNGD